MRIRSFVIVSFVVALGGASFAACSNYGEGERCDVDIGSNDDCDDGLECVPGNTLEPVQDTDRCCPINRDQATTDLCRRQQAAPGDAAPPPSVDADASGEGGLDADAAEVGAETDASEIGRAHV